ncbi:MAG: DUF1054 family protein [bacterium]|nr:DUF1054 family protein [bacterium]
MLFEDDEREFQGLPREGFDLFAIPNRDRRRSEILKKIHPTLKILARVLVQRLSEDGGLQLHASLPQLNWPRDYQPFCTWLALSSLPQGYQAGPQINLGVHADHVGVRLGWDTSADAFGRFEFLCLHGGLGAELAPLAGEIDGQIRVYAAAAWPEGSKLVFETRDDFAASFREVERRGVWWEIGRRFELPAEMDRVCSPGFLEDVCQIFGAISPFYSRVAGRSV